MPGSSGVEVRHAGPGDLDAVATLLDAFNTEFGDPSPGPATLAGRLRLLVDGGDTAVLLAGPRPDGVAVVRFRPALWSEGSEAYLAELYVVPDHRGAGIGRALVDAVIADARARGADTIEVGVDEPDAVARHLYESVGFTNRIGGDDGPVMYAYERAL